MHSFYKSMNKQNNTCALKLVIWRTSNPVLNSPYVDKITFSIFMESWHFKITLLISSTHLIQIRTTVHLSRLFSVSIIAILPWLFEKLMVDLHLSTDMILFDIPKTHSTGARQGELGGRKWRGRWRRCAALATILDECNGALSSKTFVIIKSFLSTSSKNLTRRNINLTNVTPEIVLFERSQIHSPSTHKANIRFALFKNLELIIELLSPLGSQVYASLTDLE